MKAPKKRIAATDVAALWEGYCAGVSCVELGARTGRSGDAVRRLLRDRGYKVPERAVPQAVVAQMHADYMGGMSLTAVAAKYRRGKTTLGALFARRGLKVKTRSEALRGKKRPGVKQPLRWPLALVEQMHADYMAGMGTAVLGRKYGKDRGSVLDVFRLRGLEVRENPQLKARMGADGCFQPLRPATGEEIAAMVAGLKRIMVPPALKAEWRHWTLERRGEFVRQVRASLEQRGILEPPPDGPLSKNVRRWDYGTAEAHKIAARLDAGHTSRTAPVKIKLGSSGLIWQGRLWTWTPGTGYLETGKATSAGREQLHHAVWEAATGERLPRHAVLRMRDGNWNNLTVANMERMSRNELARENHAGALTRKSRGLVAALLTKSQTKKKTNHEHSSSTDIILALRKRSARIAPAADGG